MTRGLLDHRFDFVPPVLYSTAQHLSACAFPITFQEGPVQTASYCLLKSQHPINFESVTEGNAFFPPYAL